MKTRFTTALILVMAIIAAGGPAAAQEKGPGPLKMTLAECIARAFERDPEILAEALGPDISRQALQQEKDIFLPTLGMNYSKEAQTVLGTWGIEGTNYRYKYDYFLFSLDQKLPTGASLSLQFTNTMYDTGRSYTVINPAYGSTLRVTASQPLLKGFGATAAKWGIRKAEKALDSAHAALEIKLADAVYLIETAYWDLVNTRENLEVLEKTLERSRAILAKAREAARIGAKSELEVMNAETEVARYEDGVVSAGLLVQKAEDSLRRLMNMPPGREGAGDFILPTGSPDVTDAEPDLDEAVATALRERPEIRAAENTLASAGLDAGYYRNQALPQLNLELSGWLPGQSGVKYVYENDDPFNGALLDIIRGNRWDSFSDMFHSGRSSWSVGLSFSLPLADIVSRAQVAGADLTKKQQAYNLEARRRDISFEVADALKEVANKKRKVASAAAYRRLLEKRVEAEVGRYNLGLVGSDWLFTYQGQLAEAKAGEIQAAVDYRLARTRLEKVMGTLLGSRNVRFRDAD